MTAPPRALPSARSVTLPLIAITTLMVGFGPRWAAGQEPSGAIVDIDSVTVNITRGPTRVGRSPYAVSVLRGRELQMGNSGFSLEEALQALPGVQIQNRYNYSVGEKVSIRGFGARSQFGVRGVKILVDGIPATLADGQGTLDHLDLGSLGRVEVLRGPSSALYGNGAGGVLSFETRPPPTVSIRQEARAVAGGNGLFRFQSTTSGTAGGLGYLLNVSSLKYDGFRTHPNKPGALYGLTDRVTVNAQVSSQAGGGSLKVTANYVDLSAENPGQLPRSFLDDGNLQAWRFNVEQNTRKDVRQGQLGASWTGPMGDLDSQLVVWGLFRKLDNPIPPRVVGLDRTAWGARTLFSTDAAERPGQVQWLGGFDSDFQRDDRLNFYNDGGERGEITRDQFETVRAVGVFLQTRGRLTERLSVVGALRYDRFRFAVDDALVAAGDPDDSGDRVMSGLSPSLGLHVQLTESFSVYGNLGTAITTPTTTELANQPSGQGGFNPRLDPVRSTTFEVGARGVLSDRMGYEAAAFLTALDDELIAFEDPVQAGRTFFRNAGSSRYVGFEAALRTTLVSSVSARVAYTYVAAEFDEFRVDGEVFDDNRIPGLAPHRLDGLLRISRNSWFGEIRGDYVDRVPVDNGNSAFADSYWLIAVRAGIDRFSLGRLEISPFGGVTNLFDNAYSASVSVNAFRGRFFEPGPGRAIYIGLGAAY
ncbi:MAG: TonB-dependent receptor [Gemmatimonadota bacterium]|nr:MAG: TonB-dependent receptor [Gemmatimonadota bacterium]